MAARAERFNVDELNKAVNAVQKDIAAKKKAGEPCDDLLAKKKAIEAEREGVEKALAEIQEKLRAKLSTVGNIVHESVPDSLDEVRRRQRDPLPLRATLTRSPAGGGCGGGLAAGQQRAGAGVARGEEGGRARGRGAAPPL